MPPPQPFGQEDLVDAAPLDRDALVLVVVRFQAIQRPAGEGPPEALRIGQRDGDDLGALLGGIGRRAPGAGLILQPMEPVVIEPMDPGVDRRPRDAQVLGHLAGSSPVGDGQEDPGPLNESGPGGARSRKLFEGLASLGGEFAERDFAGSHGCTSFARRPHPFYVSPWELVLLPDAPLTERCRNSASSAARTIPVWSTLCFLLTGGNGGECGR
jgi:hypothetical protein